MLPKLYKRDSKSRVRVFHVAVKDCGEYSEIIRRSGLLDGQQQTNVRVVEVGKNLGKSNETTHYQQACLDAESFWNKKVKEGYSEDINATPKFQPMLAKTYSVDTCTFPCRMQPKLNGVRCIVTKTEQGVVGYSSREGNLFKPFTHLTQYLDVVMDVGDKFDSELYIHGLPLALIVSLAKGTEHVTFKGRTYTRGDLECHLYDIISDADFSDRSNNLFMRSIDLDFIEDSMPVKLTPTTFVPNSTVGDEMYKLYIENGYEGAMYRSETGPYEQGKRSKLLLKRKDFKDSEFKIVGVERDVRGCVIFKCNTKEGKEFGVVPKGSLESRNMSDLAAAQCIGKFLTVRYSDMSKDGIPSGNPVGIVIRDYE